MSFGGVSFLSSLLSLVPGHVGVAPGLLSSELDKLPEHVGSRRHEIADWPFLGDIYISFATEYKN